MPSRPNTLHWRSWVSRHFTPAVVVVVGATLALGVAASDTATISGHSATPG